MAWFGDCNNVLHSLVEAAGLFRFDLHIATPAGYLPDQATIAAAQAAGANVIVTADPLVAARNADVLITDAQHLASQFPEVAFLGHASVEYDVAVAREADVRTLVLYHHDPWRTDDEVDDILRHARELAGDDLEVRAAYEGLVLEPGA